MKNIFTLVIALLISISTIAQQGINYKAVVKDASGNLVTGQTIGVQFTILEDAVVKFVENHITSSTDVNGIIILNIGQGATTTGSFETIDWSKTTTLKTEVDIDGGLDNLVNLGTTKFKTVPYALNATSVTPEVIKIDDLQDAKTLISNIGIGFQALNSITTGTANTANGYQALASNTTGSYNTANGFNTLNANTEGYGNTANGDGVLLLNTSGYNNTANGTGALTKNISGSTNTANGTFALFENTIGSSNTTSGTQALFSNTEGNYNSAMGFSALYSNITGSNNVSVGLSSGHFVDGSANVFIGVRAGAGAVAHNKTGGIFIGYEAGKNEENSSRLYIEPSSSATPLIYGEFDTDLLRINGTLDINDAYQFPTADGTVNQTLLTDGAGNLAWQTPSVSSGLEQITEGSNTGWRLLGGEAGVADDYGPIGNNAIDLSFAASPGDNYGATGDFSTALGRRTRATGHESTAMGYLSRAFGDQSTAMGFFTNASGKHSTAIGWETTASSMAETVIGRLNTIQTPDNTNGPGAENWNPKDRLFAIGNGYIDEGGGIYRNNALTVLKNGKVGIGRSIPSSLLEVAHLNSPPTSSDYTNAFGIHNIGTGSSWQLSTVNAGHLNLYKNGSYRGYFNQTTGAYTQASDRRVKKDIISLDNGTLNKVMQLNPVSYLMKDQTDSKRNIGLISQEVQDIFPTLTSYVDGQDLLALSYTELIPILLKALQEQQGIIEKQDIKNTDQDKTITSLLQRMKNLENASNK